MLTQAKTHQYLGLMSGTSVDAIDLAWVEVTSRQGQTLQCRLLGQAEYPIATEVKRQIGQLCSPWQFDETQGHDKTQIQQQLPPYRIELLAEMDQQLGRLFAEAVNDFIDERGIERTQIRAIGSHGQTIRHRPQGGLKGHSPFTLQIGDGNLIAHRTGISTVADFRRADLAAGGQGAPLVPAFHAALMRSSAENRVIVNLGGIANITWLPQNPEEQVVGFDTGPANTLLDSHYQQLFPDQHFDQNGGLASQGTVDEKLLEQLLSDPYFQRTFPKSCGREYFSWQWLQSQLNRFGHSCSASDLQATLVALTAISVKKGIDLLGQLEYEVYLCGGGVHNPLLCQAIAQALGQPVFTTQEINVSTDSLEAMAFAWLAHQRLENLPGNLPSVTGAERLKVLGAVYHP